MYGMQKMTMTSRNRQVRELLSSISKAFKMTPYPLSAQAVGNCFYGEQFLQHFVLFTRTYMHRLTQAHTCAQTHKCTDAQIYHGTHHFAISMRYSALQAATTIEP